MLTLIANVLGACGLSKLATRGREGRFREIHTFAARIEIRPIFELSRVPVATPPLGGEFFQSGSRHWLSIESCSLFKASMSWCLPFDFSHGGWIRKVEQFTRNVARRTVGDYAFYKITKTA